MEGSKYQIYPTLLHEIIVKIINIFAKNKTKNL